jgi:hypothetical protein
MGLPSFASPWDKPWAGLRDHLPDLGDQLLHSTLHLSIYVVGKIIGLPSRIWNVPGHNLAAFLQVSWPSLLLRNNDGKVGCGSGSSSVPRPSLADSVMGTGAMRGPPPPEGASVDYPLL